MIYLDNAATGGRKSETVYDAVTAAVKHLCVNPTRSNHRLAEISAGFVFSARENLQKYFNAPDVSRVIFTKNCTEALNIALLGLLNSGDHAVYTCYEHNSVLRPLEYLSKRFGVELTCLHPPKAPYFTHKRSICFGDVRPLIRQNTAVVVTTHASNVTGHGVDVEDIGNGIKKHFPHVKYVVDGAQTAGHLPIDMQKFKIDALCIAGHKGMGGIMGSGALMLGDGVDVRPVYTGGTGTETFNLSPPECYPERLECGTLNLPAIIGLNQAAADLRRDMLQPSRTLYSMTEQLISSLKELDDITLYSPQNAVGIVAFSVRDIPSTTVAEQLSARFDIAVRGGYHCAPLMHKYLGTAEGGLVRASLSRFTTHTEIKALINALKLIIQGN